MCINKANVVCLREQDFTSLLVFPLRFPFSPNLINRFSALQILLSPKIFTKNLFEMLINLALKCTGKQPLFLLHRHVQYKNPIRNYYSNQNVVPRHVQTLIASVEKADENYTRRRNKTLSHELNIHLSQLHYKKANCGNILGC